MTIYIIIYLIGYVLAYYVQRYTHKLSWRQLPWNYNEVTFALFFSLFSWIGVIIVSQTLVLRMKNPKFLNKKPPKWL